ncbi:hypothetical protein LCGC14_1912170 [marine sediment metagenome]|uniref:Uncharacterized protein n=1 Tax=marine sediment metagenome TaxID=412755 RepID=A0A0F9FT50_9ZZZZ
MIEYDIMLRMKKPLRGYMRVRVEADNENQAKVEALTHVAFPDWFTCEVEGVQARPD